MGLYKLDFPVTRHNGLFVVDFFGIGKLSNFFAQLTPTDVCEDFFIMPRIKLMPRIMLPFSNSNRFKNSI